MKCQPDSANPNSDKLELQEENFIISSSSTWLVYQAIVFLNSSDRQAEDSYKYVLELLSKNEAAKSIMQLLRTVSKKDIMLQWNLIYILGDLQDKTATSWLSKYAVEKLPERSESCEGPRDSELLLRTAAIESIKKIAVKNTESSEYIVKIIAGQPEREVLIEAVKAAIELGLKEQIIEILPKEYHWVLDIKKARIQELHADPERVDLKEIAFTPPKKKADYNSPSIKCACTKGGQNHG